MTSHFSSEQAEEHNRLYKTGWALLNPYLLLHDRSQSKPGWLARMRLRRAATCFQGALAINPEGWQSMWALGKLHQCLEQHEKAYHWLQRAAEVNPDQPDILREAGIEALETHHHREAVDLFGRAAGLQPENGGHHANQALALLIAGSFGEARRAIDTALQLAPADAISRRIARVVDLAESKRIPQPRSVRDVLRAAT